MTQPTHHPSEDLLFDYSRGSLAAGPARVLSAHVGACPVCRAQVRLAEAVGGAMIEEIEPAPMSPDALERALAAIDAPPPPAAPSRPPDWIRVPPDVVAAARRSRRIMAPGVWVAMIEGKRARGPRSYLLGVEPRISVPLHTHRGREFLCVVKGELEDRGIAYGPGDFVVSDEAVSHEPRVIGDGECVCLVAADDALVPLSLTAKLFHQLARI